MTPDIRTIDCHYIQPGRACAFLIMEGGRAAFVDNNTNRAIPHLLAALAEAGMRPEQVDYAIVTHVHLDHAGGTAELLRHCPNATVLCHPKAARHLTDPTRLVAASKQVYGDEWYEKLYGEIGPCDASRVRTVADGERMQWGARTLTFLHTLGHATHHICIHDAKSNGLFAGDNFGICYPELTGGKRPYIFCACTPTEFDPGHSRQSLERMLATGATKVYMNHFGTFEWNEALIDQFRRSLDRTEEIIGAAAASELEGSALNTYIGRLVQEATNAELRHCGLPIDDTTHYWVAPDVLLNTSGLTYAAIKRRNRRSAPVSVPATEP